MLIEQVMTRDVITVDEDTPLKKVAAILAERRISGVPVCRPDGRLAGVVSENDILFKEIGLDATRFAAVRSLGGRRASRQAKTGARTAGEAMTAPAITIGPRMRVADAARLMVERVVNRLPVVEGELLVGIVTRADLVQAFVRSDEEISTEISDEIIRKTLWIPAERVAVDVRQGEVELAGTLDRKSEAELLLALARRVPGVVAVEHRELSWLIDDVHPSRGDSRLLSTLPF